ncbi:E3 ubiquitin-protein ligase TRIM9-like [Montipora foliosa]|uniref:E3 ubiquitin-protein ligase TRIM9-like n=1 Tax=Montipora foliosa TaxID=591990 RepID=UPI0035F1EAB6
MEVELTCPVCLELFQKPVVLPCSHNLCTPCARKILEPHGAPKVWAEWVKENRGADYKSHLDPDVKCPTCRRKIPIDPRGVDGLAKNLILENVIERFKEERKAPGQAPEELLLCQFCEDYSPQKATLTCNECAFLYCGKCFDACHPSRGPLAGHTVGPAVAKPLKRKEESLQCQQHKQEKLALYCFDCKEPVCYMCKEYGYHNGHAVELLEPVFRKAKEELARTLGTLTRKNYHVQKTLQSLEGMCTIAKKSGCDVEAHVKRECDSLISIVEKKKAELLKRVSDEYQEKLAELNSAMHQCEHVLLQGDGLAEFTQEALKEDNPATFLQTASSLKTRLNLMLETIRALPSASSITPTFDHMAVDTSWERKILKKVTWLQIPESPSFILSQCKAVNRTVKLFWNPPPSAVDAYYLEANIYSSAAQPHDKEECETVNLSLGTTCKHSLECLHYDCRVIARVRASNRAGEGPFSEDIAIDTDKGLHFTLDPTSCSKRELVFTRDLSVAKLTGPVLSNVEGNVALSSGCHYWKIRIDQFLGTNSNGFIAIGVAKKLDDTVPIGNDTKSFALQIFENDNLWCENSHNRLQVKQKAKDIKGSNIAVLLDMEQQTMNIYWNGRLQTDDSRPSGPSLVGIVGPVKPAFTVFGSTVQLSLRTGLKKPTKCSGPPVIHLDECTVENTKINLAWSPPENGNVDSYIVEIDSLDREGDIHQERNFIKVYQGPRTKYTVRGLDYNVTVLARVKALNTAGESEPSDEVSLSTERGVIFKLDKDSLHESLRLSRDDLTVKQTDVIHANAYGTAFLVDGCHFWMVNIDSFKGENAFIAVGVAKKISQDSILGNNSSSYALQVFEGATARTENTKHKIQIKRKAKDLKESSFGVLLDLKNQFLNIYLDGELQTDIGRPKGPTFKGLSGEMCAGLCLYGSKVEMSIATGIATPLAPDQPVFNKARCKVNNTTALLGWLPPNTKSCVDFYVLEVDIVKTSDFEGRRKKDRKFKRLYEGPAREYALYSVPYSMKIISRVFGVNPTGEGSPSEELVMSTPKGLYFQLDPTSANHDLELSNENCTVSLKSPMYTFILGNVKLDSACHYWRVHVDEFNSHKKLSIIGVGIARQVIEDPILGEDTDSFAVQINEHPNASCSNTRNRLQIKRSSKELTHANIGVLLNLDEHFLNLYLNGKLLTDQSRPNGPTFVGISGEFYPALSLYGTNVKLTVHTGESYDI